MKNHTGRDLLYNTYKEKYYQTKGTRLYLKNIPIANLVSVNIDGTLYDVSEFMIFDEYIYYSKGWNCEYYIEIQYEGGYEEGTANYETLKNIEREIASIIWKRGGSGHFTIDQYGVANFSTSQLDAEMKELITQLDIYKRILI